MNKLIWEIVIGVMQSRTIFARANAEHGTWEMLGKKSKIFSPLKGVITLT